MDALMLSRIQFAVTVGFHFIFVPLTIGLVILLAVMETKYARTLNPLYRRMADFWGKLFAINFVLGIVTGLTMEFQIGMNWSEYSKYMGDIFGSPLAIEALVAFFLESTFMGIWLFGRDKISPKLRAFSIWMVALGTNISALWIITANGFMQNPVGYVIRNNRAELESFTALVTNPYAWYMFFHTVISAYICGAFFVLAISAYHILRKNELEFFKKSFKYALVMALFASIATPAIGHQYGTYVVEKQPAKGAALEAVWETGKGQPFHLIQIPDGENEKNSVEAISIPKLGSFLFTNDPNGEITGLKDIPKDERPNVPLVFWSFRIMVALGMFFIFAAAYGAYLQVKNKLVDAKRYLKMMSYSIVLPYIAINAGWVVAEAGRQPWTVYGLMKTADAVSPLATSQIVFSLGSLVFFYLILGFADIYLLVKYARKGPALATNVQEGGVKHVS
ncbi:MAG: cytochrome bd-type quinol oxidase subunit 1 [Bacillales bacterium]|jgi:cytochrome d ubiquinol oxidase subunit I|nr:cytochrome bd-type quinol oxidase subunit 1 [Bacillales bacterium]